MKKNPRVLIVNRGEIAIRIAQALRELEMIPVGLYTDFETKALHLKYCDEWVHLPGASNTQTYLNQDLIFKLCKDYEIDAVHPGYGFLAENANFAQKCLDHNIIFIGPHPTAIEKMGDKAVSKNIAHEAGVPTIPGSKGEVGSVEEALKIASEIKYPILLKAVAGGGGKGMRTCYNEEELKKNFDTVRRESLSSFGNDGVLVEKFIENPHHIEVQILCDKKGNVFHCFERECSVQRRHQKIVEEAPSPFIGDDHKLRQQICEVACKLAREVGYDSAGTVEFVMGEDKSFYFLEMNTRIQVEHPITEEVTGIDLVRNMILAAFEKEMDIKHQDDIRLRGHAIECRICAEDPVTMLPAPGKIHTFHHTFGQGVRFDHCIYSSMTVKSEYDPMIAKLITYGLNRRVAIEKMQNSLKNLTIRGLKNNIELHKVILAEESFQAGHYNTNYIKEIAPQDKLDSQSKDQVLIEEVLAHFVHSERN